MTDLFTLRSLPKLTRQHLPAGLARFSQARPGQPVAIRRHLRMQMLSSRVNMGQDG